MSKDYLQTSMFCDWNIWSQGRSPLSKGVFIMINTFKLANCIVKAIFWHSWENVCQGLFLSICWRERWTSIIPLSPSAKWLLKDHQGPLNLELPISLELLNGVGIKIVVRCGSWKEKHQSERNAKFALLWCKFPPDCCWFLPEVAIPIHSNIWKFGFRFGWIFPIRMNWIQTIQLYDVVLRGQYLAKLC